MQQHSKLTPKEAVLDGTLSLETAFAVASGQARPVLSDAAQTRLRDSHARMQGALKDRRHIYGLTTGFGPLANRLVDPADGILLQQNLVHHLASGVGPNFNWLNARAIVLARLNAILQGVSGASPRSVDMLMAVLRSDLAPAMPSRGTVGASGDLTPLAHMVLCFQGRAAFLTKGGGEIDGPSALASLGQAPLDLSERDGLALVNGTSAMTGIALCNGQHGARLVNWGLALAAVLAECLAARREAWDPVFATYRPHQGQRLVTAALNARLKGASRPIATPIAQRRLDIADIQTEDVAGQDAYTLRCVPQVLGAVQDVLDWHNTVVTTELNAATDNPLFPPGHDAVALHGGNFMGQHVGLASDSLGQAICVLAGLAERQIARLTDEKLNAGLPAFLHGGKAGLNSGFMGAQVTATALLAEMRSQSPASIQSISTNGANQDVVSMGTIAARGAHRQIVRGFEIISILALCVAQAVDILKQEERCIFSDATNDVTTWIRAHSAFLSEDRPLGPEIQKLSSAIQDISPPGPHIVT